MKFLCLTEPELIGVKVKWGVSRPLTPTILQAARTVGCSEKELERASLGILEEDFLVSSSEIAKTGGIVIMGTNGTMFLELAE